MRSMRNALALAVFAAALIGLSGSAQAAGLRYGIGSEGYMVASTPEEGSLYKMYNVAYFGRRYRDDNGNKVAGRNHVNSFTQVHRFLFTPKPKFFGFDWHVQFAVPVSWTNMSADAAGEPGGRNRTGLGDLVVVPFLLAYHADRFQFNIGTTVYLPTGNYSKDDPASPGKGFLSVIPCVGFTYFFDRAKTFNFSNSLNYEYNSTIRHTDKRYGSNMIWEWALGKSFDSGMNLSVVGGSVVGLGKSHGFGAANREKIRKHGIGAEIGYSIPAKKLDISARVVTEYKTRNAAEGLTAVFNVVKRF